MRFPTFYRTAKCDIQKLALYSFLKQSLIIYGGVRLKFPVLLVEFIVHSDARRPGEQQSIVSAILKLSY